jgi:flagellar biosynthesis protein FliR
MIPPGVSFFSTPIFGSPQVPIQLRLVVALAVGIPATAQVPMIIPPEGIISVAGISLIIGEVLAGLAIGFAVQIGFSAALLAGETIGNTMGLGFAAMIDPTQGTQSAALSTLLTILATFLFLAMDGHLLLATTVYESYRALPPGQAWLGAESMRGLVMFGGDVFAAGLAIALPVGFALILVQLVMAMLARSAPALNIFAVGLPATLLAGIILLAMGAPVMADGITAAFSRGLDEAHTLALGH